MVSTLVQNTVMAKVVIASKEQLDRSQEQIKHSAELLHDQAVIYSHERDELKDLIGFKSANTSRMVNTIKEKLSDKLGIKVLANNPMFIKVKKEVFREFSVVKWEDIAVERYSAVYAFVDTYISEMK